MQINSVTGMFHETSFSFILVCFMRSQCHSCFIRTGMFHEISATCESVNGRELYCTGHGSCVFNDQAADGFTCTCDDSFSGKTCNTRIGKTKHKYTSQNIRISKTKQKYQNR